MTTEATTGEAKPAEATPAEKLAEAAAAPAAEAAAKPAEAAATEAKGYWPEDWQSKTIEQIGLDKWEKPQQEAFKKQFGRLPSPAEMAKSWWSSNTKLNEVQAQLKDSIRKPGANATAEEKAAYYKAIGRPDKAEDYKLDRPDGAREPTEFEKTLEGDYLKQMFDAGATQDQVAAGWKIYQRAIDAGKARLEMEGARMAQATSDKLSMEMGPSKYKASLELANRAATELFGPEVGQILSMKLHDGPALGALEPFVRGMIKLGAMMADDGAVIAGVTTEGVDVDKRIDELVNLRATDRNRYQSREVQDELMSLIAVQDRRKANGAGRMAEHGR